MDDREQLFLTWVPPPSPWAAWAKPVPFAHAPGPTGAVGPNDADNDVDNDVDLAAVPTADGATAVVVDLPGATAVAAGLVLADRGYRPVPLFNAVPASGGGIGSVVDVWPTVAALAAGAARLRAAAVPADAPPAFLLDAHRRVGRVAVTPGVFDNRSVSLPTDFPSAGRLRAAGVGRAILVQPAGVVPQADLAHTLRRWQQDGIRIVAADGPRLVPVTVTRPGGFRSMWHSVLATAGLRPHPLGGFGGVLPVPSAG